MPARSRPSPWLAVALALFAQLAAESAARAQYIESFTLPGGAGAAGLAEGPDGKLWVTDAALGKIYRIARDNPAQVEAIFTLPAGWSPRRIAAGPGGALWFAIGGAAGNRIGRITTTGTVSDFPLPTAGAAPVGVAAGPDGNLWFTESAADRVARITPTGTITEYPLPNPGSQPWEICAGPDGALWFSELGANRAGRITTAGAITEVTLAGFDLSHTEGIVCDRSQGVWASMPGLASRLVRLSGPGAPAYSPPLDGLAAGFAFSRLHRAYFTTSLFSTVEIGRLHPESGAVPMRFPSASTGTALQFLLDHDGDLWWIDGGQGLGRITTGSGIEEYPVGGRGLNLGLSFGGRMAVSRDDLRLLSFAPDGSISETTLGDYPAGHVLGPDGNLWYTTEFTDAVVRRTPQGDETPFAVDPGSGPRPIVVGRDGNLWFNEEDEHRLGRLTPQGQLTEFALGGAAEGAGLAVDGDGSLWFARQASMQVSRMTTAGVVTDFDVPWESPRPCAPASAPDGSVLFVDASALLPPLPQILRATPAGVITSVAVLPDSPQCILAVDATGAIWWTVAGAPFGGTPARVCVRRPGELDVCSALLLDDGSTLLQQPHRIALDTDGNPWVLVTRGEFTFHDTVARIEAALFRNGFETGDTSSWSAAAP